MYNEIDGNFDDVAISTFKVGLPNEHGLRKSLIGKLVTSMRRLMDQINKYKRVEEDQQKEKVKRRLSLKRRGISGWTDLIPFDLGKIILDQQDLPMPKWLVLYFENRCTKFLRR